MSLWNKIPGRYNLFFKPFEVVFISSFKVFKNKANVLTYAMDMPLSIELNKSFVTYSTPIILQTTFASSWSKRSSQTVPHTPENSTSTLPIRLFSPPTRRTVVLFKSMYQMCCVNLIQKRWMFSMHLFRILSECNNNIFSLAVAVFLPEYAPVKENLCRVLDIQNQKCL